MQYRNYKNTNYKVSLLGLGCMRFPKISGEAIDEIRAQEIIDYAVENGLNYFDTAYPYHARMSEEFLGRALQKYKREDYQLATKMPVWVVEKQEDVEKIFTEQLQKLKTDYFDFYLIHALNKDYFAKCKEFHIYEFLKKKKEEGIIRNLGFSFHDTPEFLEEVCNTYEWDFVQLQLNYLDWEKQDAKAQYEILEKHSIPCIVMEPVRGGALASLCPESDRILKDSSPNASIASWAIRYAASLPNVLTVLSGMSNMEQVKDNIKTMEHFQSLSEEESVILQKALDIYKKTVMIPCTECRYCMDCPNGVDIPGMFQHYNDYAISQNKESYKQIYENTDQAAWANQCVACNICTSHCPQSINIPEELAKISKFTEENLKTKME